MNLIIRQEMAAKRWNRRLLWQRWVRIGSLVLLFVITFIISPWLLFFEYLKLGERSYYLVAAFLIVGVVLIARIDIIAQEYRLKRLVELLNDFVLIDDLCFYNKIDAAFRSWDEVGKKLYGRFVFEVETEFTSDLNPAIRQFHLQSPLPFTDISANYLFALKYDYEHKQWLRI